MGTLKLDNNSLGRQSLLLIETAALKVNPRLPLELQKLGATKLARCYNCGTCTAICPLSEEGAEFPRKLIRYAIAGLEDKLLSSPAPWLCYYCGDCSAECPRDADPGSLMMAVRRYATISYSWGRLGSIFYKSPLSAFGAVLLLTVIALLGIFVLRGQATFSPADLSAFFSFGLIHDIGLLLGAFVAASVLANLLIMMKHLDTGVGKRVAVAIRAKVWLSTLASSVVRKAMGQVEFLQQCGTKNRYVAHMSMFWGFLGLGMATLVDFIIGLGKVPLYPIPPQRILGIVSGMLLAYGSSYFIYKRVKKDAEDVKYSHFTDWIFLTLLFLSAATGLLLTLSLYTNWSHAAYALYILHLVVVFDLIILAPFTKFAHAIYRPLAVWMNEAQTRLAILEVVKEVK